MDSQGSILPALKPADWVGRETSVCRPLIEGQTSPFVPLVAFGYDQPSTFRFLSTAQIPGAASPQDRKLIEQAALRNLRARKASWKAEQISLGRTHSLHLAVCGDDFLAAERILDPDFMRLAHSLLRAEKLAVAVPRRGVLLATNARQPEEFLSRFAAAVSAEFYSAHSAPISPVTFIVADGQIVGMITGLEESARDATRAQAPDAEVYCSALVVRRPETHMVAVEILVGGAVLESVTQAAQNALVQMAGKLADEGAFGGKVVVLLIPDLTPRTQTLEEDMTSIAVYLAGFAAEVGLKTRRGDPLRVSVRYGAPDPGPGTGTQAAIDLYPGVGSPDAFLATAGTLRRMGPRASLQGPDQGDVASWVQALQGEDAELAAQAARQLGVIGDPQAIQPLTEALGHWSPEVRSEAYRSLPGFGSLALEALLPRYDSQDTWVRQAVVRILGQIADAGAKDVLLRALLDASDSVRAAAVAASGRLRDPWAFLAVLAALLDESGKVQSAAASVLGDWGDPRASAPLALVRRDATQQAIRNAASEALRKLGRETADFDALLPQVEAWAERERPARRRTIFEHKLAFARVSGSRLVGLARESPPEFLRMILAAVLELRGAWEQITTCINIAGVLPELFQEQAIQQAIALTEREVAKQSGQYAAQALVNAVARSGLAAPLQAQISERAIAIASAGMPEGPQDEEWAKAMLRLGYVKKGVLPVEVETRLLKVALDAAGAIDDPARKAPELVSLVVEMPHRPAQIPVLRDALHAALLIQSQSRRMEKLQSLAARVTYDLQKVGLTIASEVADPARRAEAFLGMARSFPEPLKSQARKEALSMAGLIENRLDRVEVLGELAEHGSEQERNDLLDMAREIADAEDRAITLGALAQGLPEPLATRTMQEALKIARDISDQDRKANAFGVLVSYLLVIGKADVETLLMGEKGIEVRNRAWRSLFPGLKDRMMSGVVLGVLAGLAPRIPQSVSRASVLSLVALRAPGKVRWRLIRSALAAAREIEGGWLRARVLSALAWYLPKKDRPALLDEERAIVHQMDNRTLCLSLKRELLDSHLHTGAYFEIIVAALGFLEAQPPDKRGFALVDVALGAVAPIEGKARQAAVQEAVATARQVPDDWMRSRALSGLAKHFPRESRAEALDAALQVADPARRAGLLTTLLQEGPTGSRDRSRIIRMALEAVRSIADIGQRIRAAAELLDLLGPSRRSELAKASLVDVREISDGRVGEEALRQLSLHLPAQLLPESLQLVLEILDKGFGSSAFAEIVQHLPAAEHRKALDAAKRIRDDRSRVAALSAVSNHLEEALRDEALRAARETAQQQTTPLEKARLMVGMVHHLPIDLRPVVMDEVIAAVRDIVLLELRRALLAELERVAPGEYQMVVRGELEDTQAQLSESLSPHPQ